MAIGTRTPLAYAVFILVLAAGQAPAATLCVDSNNPACFRTIQEAIDAAYDFDIIEVHPGVYREHINYNGALVTVKSLDPNDDTVVESTIIDGGATGNVVTFRNSEGPYSILQGFTISNGQNGIECTGADTAPLIRQCRVVSNRTTGIACSSCAKPTVAETLVADNKTAGISGSCGQTSFCQIYSNGSGKDGDAGLAGCGGLVQRCVISANNGNGTYNQAGAVKNCVVSANLKSGLYWGRGAVSGCNIRNCCIVGNSGNGMSFYPDGPAGLQFSIMSSIIVLNANFGAARYWTGFVPHWQALVDYSNLWGNVAGDFGGNGSDSAILWKIGDNLISVNPFFAKAGYWDTSMVWHEGDYHLKSRLGRWDPRSETWVTDPIDSPCLDRGDPADGFGEEPYPHGGRINQGAYGGTTQASKSDGPKPMCTKYPEMDFNQDCKVDQADMDLFLRHWLECGLDPAGACWPDGAPVEPIVRH